MIDPLRAKFEPNALATTFLYNDQTKTPRLLRLPDQAADDAHRVLARHAAADAGFKESDIPTTWKEYWSFWCDKVQPAYRQKTGNRAFGIGQPLGVDSSDSFYLVPDLHGRLQRQAGQRQRQAAGRRPDRAPGPDQRADRLHAPSTPRAARRRRRTSWKDPDNNVAFFNKTTVMTHNATISIAAKWLDDANNATLTEAQRATALKNYKELMRTAGFPTKPDGSKMVYRAAVKTGVIFKDAQEQGRGQAVRRLPARRGEPHALRRGLARPLVPGDQGGAAERLLEGRQPPPLGLQPVHERARCRSNSPRTTSSRC